MAYDVVIRNGTVIDGSGSPAYRGDVALQGGKIAAIGQLKGAAGKTLDAEGLAVAPGFFDLHTHYDAQLLWDPLATSSCWHGITTILMGNCGFTIAPGRPSDADYLTRMMARVEGITLEVLQQLDWDWETFPQYLGRLQGKLGVNVAAMVGHSALRYYVMGPDSQRSSTPEELGRMQQVLRESLAAGAMGFSTAQSGHVDGNGNPVPSRHSTPEEIFELGRVVGEFPRGIIGINPKPGGGMITPEAEVFLDSLARATGRTILYNQLMHRWDAPDQWRKSMAFLDREGGRVYAMARCQSMDLEFNLARTYMFDQLPTWKAVLAMPHEEKKRLLAAIETRALLRKEWEENSARTAGRRTDLLGVARTKLSKNKGVEGKRVVALAAQQGKHPVDFVLDLSLEEELETQFVYIGTLNGDPQAVEQIIKGPYCVPGLSDAGAHLDMDSGVDFTGVLLGHWVRERGVMSLEEGVRRLTSMPASLLGAADRGLLKEGMAADVVVFNPATIRALPREIVRDLPGGFPRIIQRAQGVKAVIVNGQVLIEDSKPTGALPGKVLSSVATGP